MTDSEIISHYGGPTRFAQILGLTALGSVQRVSNWAVRGIPAEIKLQHPALFGISIGSIPPLPEPELAQSPQQKEVTNG